MIQLLIYRVKIFHRSCIGVSEFCTVSQHYGYLELACLVHGLPYTLV